MLILLLAAPMVVADEGHDLFTGQSVAVSDQGAERKLARFPCHTCHGRDGLGGIEGDVPPIDWRFLSRAAAVRPAYTFELFHRAVTEGRDADGRELSRLMPRYALSKEETAGLANYLDRLHDLQRQGVASDELRIGVAVLPGVDAMSDTYRTTLAKSLEARLGGDHVYGRRITLVPVDPTSGDADILALLGLPVAAAPAFVSRGVPILAPIGALDGDEDSSILRGITPSREALHAALAASVAKAGTGTVAILASDAEERQAMELAMSLAAPERPVVSDFGAAEDIIALPGTDLKVASDWPGRIWITWQSVARHNLLPKDANVMVAIETPRIIDAAVAAQVHPLIIHAQQAGIMLAEALKAAGRDVTRANLLQALADTVLDDIGLDYTQEPLTGTDHIALIELR
ncbi:hypothetical protein [Marivita sp.]|uniref:c-type cytochrome n=1 Tax=Marivita sp. TaxID=2003365 RepID=UPI003A86C495